MDMVTESRRRLESTGMDIDWRHIHQISSCTQEARQNPSITIQKLDLSVGTMGLGHSEYCDCSGAGMELLQPILRRGLR